MTVYVDDMYKVPMGKFGRLKMSHMMADTSEELMAMAEAIGVQRKWLQHAGRPDEHFDIAMSKRAEAVSRGAVEISMRDMARMNMEKRRSFVEEKRRRDAAKEK